MAYFKRKMLSPMSPIAREDIDLTKHLLSSLLFSSLSSLFFSPFFFFK